MSWYVVHTLPHQEPRAVTNLVRQGYEVFFPSTKKTRRRARKIETVKSPLFPGYLFINLNLEEQNWTPINGTFGVKQILSDGKKPIGIRDGFVKALLDTIDEDGCVSPPKNTLENGQTVRISHGPFADQIAMVVEMASKDRVKLLLGLLGGQVNATMPVSAVNVI